MSGSDTVTLTIEDENGAVDELSVPGSLVDLFSEDGETPPEVIGDLAMLNCAQQVHAAVHHGHGEPDEELQAIEERTMTLFEDRFGVTFEEMTGHSH